MESKPVNAMIQAKPNADALPEGIAKCAVACPMCGLKHSQYRLNPQLYWFTEMDVDRRPMGFHCRQTLEGYYPPLFELWHCPQCHYTAHNRVFPDPLKHVYIEKGMVARKLNDRFKADPAMQRVVDTLGADVSFENSGFPQALRLAALEIYYLAIVVDILNQGHDSMARSYLRMAWLFRDWDEMVPGHAGEGQLVAKQLAAVAADWPECPQNEASAMRAACDWFGKAIALASSNQDPVELCTTMMQLARIQVKLGEMEEAYRQLGECQWTIVSKLDAITRAMNEDLRVGKLSEEQRGRMLSDSRKLRSMIDETKALQEPIKKKRDEAERARAKKFVQAHSKTVGPALRKLMEQEGFSAGIVREMVPEKKEGLFGGLFK
jgi:uncharacterized protein (DUF2225 family)